MFDGNNQDHSNQNKEISPYNSYNEESNSYTWTPPNQDQPVEKFSRKQKKKKEKKEKNSTPINKFVLVIVFALVFGLIAGGTMFGVNMGLNYIFANDNSNVNIPYTDVLSTSADSESATATTAVTAVDVSSVVEATMPAVVAITTTQTVDYGAYYPFGNNSSEEVSGSGSGIIIAKNDTELLIITSNHVVEDSSSVTVQFVNETSVEATVKSAEEDEDLAIVSVPLTLIDEATLSQIKIATLATEEVTVGEGAIAIGNALGYGQSVTTGVISAVNREVSVENNTLTLIQTDAAINPGNSGGALLNMKGEVIGINEAKYSSSDVEGMGFSIPISSKTEIINQLVNAETKQKVSKANKGYIGISGKDVTSEISEMYSIPEGVYITQVADSSAAKTAGLVKSDVIVEFDGESISSMEELQGLLEYYAAGDTVTLKVMSLSDNEYVEKEVKITLTAALN